MKNFINEYLKVLEVTIIGLVFIISSFYLMINYYHSLQIKQTIYVSNTDRNYVSYQDKITRIETNLRKYNTKNVNNKELYNGLSRCLGLMKQEGSLYTIKPNTYINSYEVYKLGTNFESNLYNACYALHLNNSNLEIGEFVDLTAKTINSNVNSAVSELKNNTSYHFTTNITESTVRNNLLADYKIITESYDSFASLILELSNYITLDDLGEGGNNE